MVWPTLGSRTAKEQEQSIKFLREITHKMAAKTSWRRYRTKLRHCHPMYRKQADVEPRTSALDMTLPAARAPVAVDRYPLHATE